MKLLMNKAYGGFRLSEEFLKKYPEFEFCKYGGDNDLYRTNLDLIRAVEEFGLDTMPDLKVVEIPDNWTDWELNEYDGWETVTYVVDGKLHHA